MVTAKLDAELAAIVGPRGLLQPEELPAPPWDTQQPFRGRLVLAPGTVAELSQALAACHEADQSVVPMGGVTGLVQGCATRADDVGLSLRNLDRIEEVDPVAQTISAEAGVTLRRAQEAADDAGLYFPIDIGARDTCTLGGNAATNAGGTRVIRYGMLRDSILGLEAVLADGTVLSSMNRYLKNNSGYDLKQLFIGSEGTLGVITRLVVRLDAAPASRQVAMLSARRYADVVACLGELRQRLSGRLCGFEVMWDSFFRRATKPLGRLSSPFSEPHNYYVIVEAVGQQPQPDQASFEAALASVLEQGLIDNAVIAQSERDSEALWAIRHEVEWLVRDARNFDVSLRIADAGDFVDSLELRLQHDCPDAELAAFGHLGDNNIHLAVLGGDRASVERAVYESLAPHSGAISAEHGIGLEKRAWLGITRSPAEIALMATLKAALDPRGILNPGKVIGD